MNRLKIARAYLERGWSFYPTYPKSKLPYGEICPHWTPYRDQLPTPRDIEAWFLIAPTANMALITGPLSRLCIVECDSLAALDAFLELCGAAHYADFATPVVRSRRGYHLYFQRPDVPDVRASQKAIERELGIPNLELKADLNCCTAPPSVHESGHLYKFEMSPHRYALAPLPSPMAALATRPREEPVPAGAPSFSLGDGSAYGRAALRNACDELAATREHRNDALNNAALAMGRLVAARVLDEFTVRAALCEVAASIGLTQKEIGPTFESGFRGGVARGPALIRKREAPPAQTRRPRSLAQLRGGAFA